MDAIRLLAAVCFVPALSLSSAQNQLQRHLFTFPGDSAGDRSGSAVSAAGDVDGDGFDDVLVGAPGEDDHGTDSGTARVWSGRDGSLLFLFRGDAAGDGLGASVAAAGDVNQDGFPDLFVGAPSLAGTGFARVYSGADGSVLLGFAGTADADGFATALAGAGDVDLDGFDDVAIGIPRDGGAGDDAGRVAVHSGQGGALLHAVPGAAGDRFGYSIGSGGDLNTDGRPDLVVGAPRPFSGAGYARVLSGADGAALLSLAPTGPDPRFGGRVAHAGDANGDGAPDYVVAAYPSQSPFFPNYGAVEVFSGADGSALHSFPSAPVGSGTQALGTSVGPAGDRDGDGRDDFFMGGYRTSVVSFDPYVEELGPGVVRFHSGADGSLLFELEGDETSESFFAFEQLFGRAAALVGDVDANGVPDFAVGAPTADAEGSDSGLVSVYAGAPLPLTADGHAVPPGTGGGQGFSLDAGAAFGGDVYLLLGSASGTSPGTPVGSTLLPLNPDAYFVQTAAFANQPPLAGSFGVLDASGRAAASFSLPAGTSSGLVGVTAHHAFLVVELGGADPFVAFASNPVPVRLVHEPCAVFDATTPDCNGNGTLDECEIALGSALDCNDNGRPDACDVALGISVDCNANGVPDECENDCNGNGIDDACDIAAGTSLDCNGNGIPDECISLEVDLNGDGTPDACQGGTTRYVDDDHPADPMPGDPSVSNPLEDGTAANPFDAIQEAIDASVSGDVVVIEDGLYQGVGNRELVYGGRDIEVRSANGPQACVVDCQGMGRGFFFGDGESSAASLVGITVKNGVASSGAAVYCKWDASPSIRDCVFTDNWVTFGGGAIYLGGLTGVEIANCTIVGNSVFGGSGGGIWIGDSSQTPSPADPLIRDCLIANNTATQEAGGIYLRGDGVRRVVIRNSTIAGNEAGLNGGGVRVWIDGDVSIRHCVLWGNTGLNGDQLALYLGAATVRLSDVQGGQAGVHLSNSTLTWLNNLDVDPLFADAPNGDYHLTGPSPCVDAGSPAFQPLPGETDIDGEPRVQGPAVDLGADEHAAP